MSYKVSEIFVSVQGEGARSGTLSCFVRLAGCPVATVCSILCDTEFESGVMMTADEIAAKVKELMPPNGWVILTGGEPLAVYDQELSEALSDYRIAVETSGAYPIKPFAYAEWITVSPKVAEHIVAKNFPVGVDELRYVRRVGQAIPKPKTNAKHYFISPEFKGAQFERADLDWALQLVRENPMWRLSVQMHKFLGVR